MRSMIAIVAAVLLLVGCGGDRVTGVPTSIAGHWVGAASGTSVTMDLLQSDKDIVGTGVLTDASGTAAITARGTYQQPVVNLTIEFPNTSFNPIFLSGTISGDVITGALNGSGYDNFAITLTRQ